MIFGSIAGNIAGSLVSAGLSAFAGGGGGGGVNGRVAGIFPNFTSGGITVSNTPAVFNKKGQLTREPSLSVFSTPERKQLVKSISEVFGRRAGDIRGLLPEVAPGFGRLTEATRDIFDSRQSKAVSDLRAAFNQARVGTSTQRFRTESAAVRDLAEAENAIQAGNFLQELDLTFNLIQAASDAEFNEQNTFLQEENLLASIATQVATGQATAINNMNQALTQLSAQNAAANAAGFGSFAGVIGEQIGRLGELILQPKTSGTSLLGRNSFNLLPVSVRGGATLPLGFNFA